MQIKSQPQASSGTRRPRHPGLKKPLAVTPKTAQQLLDIGPTKFWSLVRADRIKMTDIGDRRMVIYASLEALVADDPQQQPEAAA